MYVSKIIFHQTNLSKQYERKVQILQTILAVHKNKCIRSYLRFDELHSFRSASIVWTKKLNCKQLLLIQNWSDALPKAQTVSRGRGTDVKITFSVMLKKLF